MTHRGFKAIANFTLSQQLLETRKKTKYIYSLYPGHLDDEQNDTKVTGSISSMEGERES